MPTSSYELHIDAPMSAISVKKTQLGLVADRILPRRRVRKMSDIYKTYDDAHLTVPNTLRTRNAPSHGTTWGTTDSTYKTQKYALHDVVAPDDVANADAPIDPFIDTTETLTDLIALDREKRAATLLTSTTNLTQNTTLAGATQWDNYSSSTSDPRKIVRIAADTIYKATLQVPNVILIPFEPALILADHPQILAAKAQISGDMRLLTSGLPPQLFGLTVIQADAGENTATQGQDSSLDSVWGDNVIIAYVPPRIGLKSIALGVTFEFGGRVTRRWFENAANATTLEVEEQGLDEVIISAGCGYLVKDTISSTAFNV